jgi:hypothetical protein
MIATVEQKTLDSLPSWAVSAIRNADAQVRRFALANQLDLNACVSLANSIECIEFTEGKPSAESSVVIVAILIRSAALAMSHPEAYEEVSSTSNKLSRVPLIDFFFGFLFSAVAYLGDTQFTASDIARLGAAVRHIETYSLKAEIVAHWKREIDPKLSNEKAATTLKRHFPLSHRKLAEYVAEAKKELRSAGKA